MDNFPPRLDIFSFQYKSMPNNESVKGKGIVDYSRSVLPNKVVKDKNVKMVPRLALGSKM